MRQFLGIIPARYNSSRFPGKPLCLIHDKPLVIHVAEKAEEALGKEDIIIATDDSRILHCIERYGFKGILTSKSALTGTDRLWEVAQRIESKYYINIQGDEPMIDPRDIVRVMNEREKFPDNIINGYVQIDQNEDPNSLNIPKVIFDENERLIYMSRNILPGSKTGVIPDVIFKQVCIYAYSFDELKAFGSRYQKSFLESYEDIEILRFLEMGFHIKMLKMLKSSLAVDIPLDVLKVEEAMKK